MKKLFSVLLVLVLVGSGRAQIEDRFSFLTQSEMENFSRPLATALGSALNSGGYGSASIGTMFGFNFSVRALLISIPDNQKEFTPTLPAGYTAKPTATIFGNEGSYYKGPNGYLIYPPGANLKNLPFAFPQISASFMGAEVMLRMIPSIPIGDEKVNMFGVGARYDISNQLPMLPIDLAVGFMYNTFKVTNYIDNNNVAISLLASYSPPAVGIITFYGGLQYENSSMKLTYTYKDPNATTIGQQLQQKIEVDVKGDNSFRATVGVGLSLGFVGVNVDYNIGKLSILTGGLSFGF